jgi:hypothetical protein
MPVFNHGRGIPPLNPTDTYSTDIPLPQGDLIDGKAVQNLQDLHEMVENDDHFDDHHHEDEQDMLFGRNEP